MILNIIIMAWLAFNIVLLIDAVVFTYQNQMHKEKLYRLRHCKNWNYEKWKAGMPRRAFVFKYQSFFIFFIAAPALLTAGFFYVSFLFLSAFDAAIRAFFNTFFETLKGGAR